MVFATVGMLSLTRALLPVFATQVKETLRQVSASPG
jgi:ABC-type phosphate transport system permease subunit